MLRHLRLGGVAYSAGGESGLPSFIHPTSRRETVWKVGGGFLIACVSCFKRARWDIFALFWLLAILQIEAYWDFPDSLWKGSSEKFSVPLAPLFRDSCSAWLISRTSTTDALRRSWPPAPGEVWERGERAGMAGPH